MCNHMVYSFAILEPSQREKEMVKDVEKAIAADLKNNIEQPQQNFN